MIGQDSRLKRMQMNAIYFKRQDILKHQQELQRTFFSILFVLCLHFWLEAGSSLGKASRISRACSSSPFRAFYFEAKVWLQGSDLIQKCSLLNIE